MEAAAKEQCKTLARAEQEHDQRMQLMEQLADQGPDLGTEALLNELRVKYEAAKRELAEAKQALTTERAQAAKV